MMKNTLYFSVPENQDNQDNQNYHDAQNRLFAAIENEIDDHGHYRLPEQKTDHIDDYLNKIPASQTLTDIVVIGIGGSSLGAKAIYHFVKAARKLPRNMHFIDSTDPTTIKRISRRLNVRTTHFLVISKSGRTIETIAAYQYIRALVENANLDFFPFTFIGDAHSKLEKHARQSGGIFVPMEENLSGRFSVLGNVGLVPLALVGIRINEILEGAKRIKKDFFGGGEMQKILCRKAIFYAENSQTKSINAIFSYADSLKFFNDWYVQLWGESLGKKRADGNAVGLTPVGLIGPKDQHSFLQLIVDGARDKTTTIIKIDRFENHEKIPATPLPHLEQSAALAGLEFSRLINLQAGAIKQTLLGLDNLPLDEIVIETQDEASIGALVYYYELLVALVANFLQINAYDQPGVEAAKAYLINAIGGKYD